MEEFGDMDNNVMESFDIKDVEIKINPNYYIHNAITKAQFCLIKENMKDGFVQFRLLVENMEIICKAANMIKGDDYKNELEEFKNSSEYQDIKALGLDRASVALANKKMELLLKEIFSSTFTDTPLKG